MWDDGHGRVHGRFTLPTLEGAALKKALQAIAAPKHQAATQGPLGGAEARTRADGPAFGEYVTRYPTDQLPKAGGLNATLIVTIPLDSLPRWAEGRPPGHRADHLRRAGPPAGV